MSPFSTARSGAQAAIDEIIANARVRQRFPAFVIGQAADLFHYASDKAHIKGELQNLLQLGSPDAAVVHRGLLIQLNGVFEGFVGSLVSTHVTQIAAKVNRFDQLPLTLQSAYVVHASRALSKLNDGAINGIKYNFSSLQANMGSCFSGMTPFEINAEVFTLLMGNCTSERLERLFGQVELMEPFGDPIGKHKSIQKWCGEGKARRGANRAKNELDEQIAMRNDLVHGHATKDVVLHDVERAAEFFGAMVTAYSDLADELHS